MNKYYEHIIHIRNKLSDSPLPKISRANEGKFRLMFRMVQEPFRKYQPKDRKNFLNYSYILNKFSRLLKLKELYDYFPLLKSPSKLREQDKIWKKICEHLDWTFHSSKK